MDKILTASVNSLLMQGVEARLYFTPFHLQKLLYLYYGRYITEHDRELEGFKFEAWSYGPVISSIYHEYKTYGSSDIKRMVSYGETCYRLRDESLFREVVRQDGRKSFLDLYKWVHRPDGAWARTIEGGRNKELTFDDIKREFT